jgi:hypothetical protein
VGWQQAGVAWEVELVEECENSPVEKRDSSLGSVPIQLKIDILPDLKVGDSYWVTHRVSLRWVPAADGLTAPFTSQAIQASVVVPPLLARQPPSESVRCVLPFVSPFCEKKTLYMTNVFCTLSFSGPEGRGVPRVFVNRREEPVEVTPELGFSKREHP